jgi:hypothetical protein
MKVILCNGVELTPNTVTGTKRLVQGASRDTLTFVFPDGASLDELNRIFSAENCENITIIENDGSEYVHSGYVIRAELTREPVEVASASDTEPATYEDRVVVAMSRRTYQESQYAEMKNTIDTLLDGEG